MDQELVQVSAAVLVRYEFDESGTAIRIQRQDLSTRKRVRLLPDFFVVLVGKRVLNVELQLIVLERCKQIDQLLCGNECGPFEFSAHRSINIDLQRRQHKAAPKDCYFDRAMAGALHVVAKEGDSSLALCFARCQA